jgi:hypothetical protein
MAHVDRKGMRDFLAANGAKALANFGSTSTKERDLDQNHRNPIAPSTEATPTAPMNKTRRQANMKGGWHVLSTIPSLVVQTQLQPTAHLSFKTIRSSFWLPSLPVKNQAYVCQK